MVAQGQRLRLTGTILPARQRFATLQCFPGVAAAGPSRVAATATPALVLEDAFDKVILWAGAQWVEGSTGVDASRRPKAAASAGTVGGKRGRRELEALGVVGGEGEDAADGEAAEVSGGEEADDAVVEVARRTRSKRLRSSQTVLDSSDEGEGEGEADGSGKKSEPATGDEEGSRRAVPTRARRSSGGGGEAASSPSRLQTLLAARPGGLLGALTAGAGVTGLRHWSSNPLAVLASFRSSVWTSPQRDRQLVELDGGGGGGGGGGLDDSMAASMCDAEAAEVEVVPLTTKPTPASAQRTASAPAPAGAAAQAPTTADDDLPDWIMDG